MSKITQYARISHHTTSGYTGSVFTVPLSNDFTDGSWTIYDLAPSEFGVNETDGRAFLRCDNQVKELTLTNFVTASTIGTGSATMSEIVVSSSPGIDFYKIKIKGQADSPNYETIVSDIWFGLRDYATSSIAFTGGTYSLNTYRDFSSTTIGPQLSISGSILSIVVNGAAGYTVSWSAQIEKS